VTRIPSTKGQNAVPRVLVGENLGIECRPRPQRGKDAPRTAGTAWKNDQIGGSGKRDIYGRPKSLHAVGERRVQAKRLSEKKNKAHAMQGRTAFWNPRATRLRRKGGVSNGLPKRVWNRNERLPGGAWAAVKRRLRFLGSPLPGPRDGFDFRQKHDSRAIVYGKKVRRPGQKGEARI